MSAPTRIADRPVRLGVIGCGNVLTAYQEPIERLRNRGAIEVMMACGRPSQRAFATEALHPRHFTLEAERVLAAPDVDLVLVLTSMPQHGPLVSAALAQGKHVLVEKPLAATLAEAQKILRQPRRTHLVCAPFTLLSPTFQSMAGHLQRGEIGRPANARARYGWAGPDWNEWFFKKGGGALYDLGVYGITSLTGMIGPARQVTAFAGIVDRQRQIGRKKVTLEVEDNAQVVLDFGGDCYGSLMTGFTLQQYRGPALEIYGTKGTLQMLGDDWGPAGFEMWLNRTGAWHFFPESAPRWSWTAGLEHLVDCLQTGKQPIITPEHALHVLEIMVQARKSARTGRAQPIRSTFRPPIFKWAAGSRVGAHLEHDRARAKH